MASLQPFSSIWLRALLIHSTVAFWPACILQCLSISYWASLKKCCSIAILSTTFSFNPKYRMNSFHRAGGTCSTTVYKTSGRFGICLSRADLTQSGSDTFGLFCGNCSVPRDGTRRGQPVTYEAKRHKVTVFIFNCPILWCHLVRKKT